jgi:hypothetical protein
MNALSTQHFKTLTKVLFVDVIVIQPILLAILLPCEEYQFIWALYLNELLQSIPPKASFVVER